MRQRTRVNAALLCALAATAAVPATASAASHPIHDDGLTIAATPNDIVAGTGVLIYGQLQGSDVANQTIHLYHRLSSAPRFTLISTTTTNQYGFYEFTRAEGVVTTNRNWYAEGPDGTHSDTIHEHVASTLTLNESSASTTTGSKILFTGSVYPAHPGQEVLIQKQSSVTGSGWSTVASGRINAASTFSIAHAFRDAGDYTLRAYLPTSNANTAGSSDAATLEVQQTQNPKFTINTSNPAITTGSSVTISGTAPTADQTVELYSKSVNGTFRPVASAGTSNGAYTFTETPANNTVYEVKDATGKGQHSASLYEAVSDTVSLTAPATTATVGTPVSFSGTVSPDHMGHLMYLQVQTAKGGWQDVDSQSLTTGSAFDFSYAFGQPGTYTVRARIFGGPENVGAGSTPVTVTVSGYAPAASLPAS